MLRRYTSRLFFAISASIAILALIACVALVFLEATKTGNGRVLASLLLVNVALLGLVAVQHKDGRVFFFSGGFWIVINTTFYIILKAIDLADDGLREELYLPLLSIIVFLVGYLLGRTWWRPRIWPSDVAPCRQRVHCNKSLYNYLLISFFLFKLFNIVALALTGAGGDTILEISKSTQNQGAGYLFRIESLAHVSYLAILVFAYKSRIYTKTAVLLTVYLLLEYTYNASRSAIIVLVFLNLFLYHLYIRPVKYVILLLLAPPLLFVIAFFGFVRDIQVGNLDVYIDALGLFLDDVGLVSKLFMARMDMLPQMVNAFKLDAESELATLNGQSYIYMLTHAVPRSFWPDKPPLTAAYLTGITHPAAFSEGINLYPSIQIEAFMNFGWPGIALAGFIIAKFVYIYEKFLYSGRVSRQIFALTILTFPMGLLNEGLHSNNMAGLLYSIFLFYLWLKAGELFIGRGFAAMYTDFPDCATLRPSRFHSRFTSRLPRSRVT